MNITLFLMSHAGSAGQSGLCLKCFNSVNHKDEFDRENLNEFCQSMRKRLFRTLAEYCSILEQNDKAQLTSSNSDSNPNLNYSQAVLLLGPAGERGPPGNSGRPKRYHHRADYGQLLRSIAA